MDRGVVIVGAGMVGSRPQSGYGPIGPLAPAGLYRREPHLGHGAVAALEVPDEAIVCPFTTPLAFATEAVLAGCELRRSTPVTAIERLNGGGFRVRTTDGEITARRLVNAAGPRGDEGDPML